ncbi:MAG TPA: MM0924 family protein [Pyrinomonadaceae bacterium]|nr:MM0924 family protein [Pyrinomonadaceae bacterium]
MEELLRQFTGKKIDISCGAGVALRGEVRDVGNGVLHLRDEDGKSAYISIDKIAAVYECSDASSRPGFIG